MKHLILTLLLPLFILLAAAAAAQPAAPAPESAEPTPAAAPAETEPAVEPAAATGNAAATAKPETADAEVSAAEPQNAEPQNAEPQAANTERAAVASPDPEIVQLKTDRGELRLEIAGYGITLGNRDADGSKAGAPSEKPGKKPVKRFHGCFGFTDWEIGIPLLVDTSYGPAWAGEGEFLETSTRKSISFGYTLLGLRYMLDRHEHWWLSTGIRGNIYDIVLSGKQTIRYTDGELHAVELDPSTKKSKLSFSSLGIPLMLTYTVSDFSISLRASGNLYTSYRAVHKKPKEKYELRGMEPWSWNVGGAITYHKVGVSFDYALTPLFRSGVGPETHLFTFGICFGF